MTRSANDNYVDKHTTRRTKSSKRSKRMHGRLKIRRCFVFDQMARLDRPERWPDLGSFTVVESQRTIKGKTTTTSFYISCLPANAEQPDQAVRRHWMVENTIHWCMDVAFADGQMCLRTQYAAYNPALIKHLSLNLFLFGLTKRKGTIKARRLIASTCDGYRAKLLGCVTFMRLP